MAMPIPEYKILQATTADKLVELVNADMQEGWVPIGGITAALADPKMPSSHHCAQAMTRNLHPVQAKPK